MDGIVSGDRVSMTVAPVTPDRVGVIGAGVAWFGCDDCKGCRSPKDDHEGEEPSVTCPHCTAGEPSVWDDVLFHYAHPHLAGDKLKFCHEPWRERCRRCSGTAGACACGAARSPS